MTTATKITYTSTSGDLGEFHHRFDAALDRVRRDAGKTHPFYIDGKPTETTAEPLLDRSPIDTSLVLGRFAAARIEHVDAAVASARRAQVVWARLPWQ
jgi:1-pyrroline-5-carboxylate dehydrogenase